MVVVELLVPHLEPQLANPSRYEARPDIEPVLVTPSTVEIT
jgi:hypothetical protein